MAKSQCGKASRGSSSLSSQTSARYSSVCSTQLRSISTILEVFFVNSRKYDIPGSGKAKAAERQFRVLISCCSFEVSDKGIVYELSLFTNLSFPTNNTARDNDNKSISYTIKSFLTKSRTTPLWSFRGIFIKMKGRNFNLLKYTITPWYIHIYYCTAGHQDVNLRCDHLPFAQSSINIALLVQWSFRPQKSFLPFFIGIPKGQWTSHTSRKPARVKSPFNRIKLPVISPLYGTQGTTREPP